MTLKRIFVALSVVLVVLTCTIVPAFAIPPNDPNVVDPYEPFYMDIEGSYFGNTDALTDVTFSNTTIDFFSKSYTGLAGVEYNYSDYSGRSSNTAFPYYIYFDYASYSNNLGADTNPRMYVWCAEGSIKKGVEIVGSDTSAVGFDLQFIHSDEQLNVSVVSGGNIQYDMFTLYDVSDWLTYSYYMYGAGEWEAKVYSFRIMVIKESGTIELQALTNNWFTTIKSFKLADDADHVPTYDRLAFGTYDKVTGIVNGALYGSALFKDIRYSDYDAVYETAYAKGLNFGSTTAYRDGKNDGLEEGYWKGYAEGKTDGELDGSVSEINIPAIFDSFTGSAITLFRNIFGFEIFGINVSALIGSIALVSVFAWLIRKLVR